MQTGGLSLEQAPPLAIPLSFFMTAPLAVVAAGLVLLRYGTAALTTGWAPLTLCLTHLGTLGFLTMVMMGALYQMTAVVAGSPVPRVRLAHLVHAGFTAGVAGVCWGTARFEPRVVFIAIAVLGIALLFFIIPVGRALAKAPTRNETVLGMRAALACFVVAGFLGLWMAHGFSGMRFPGPRPLWVQVHLSVALLGWVGGLIGAVSWQVLPMFYLANPVAPTIKRATYQMTLVGVALPVVILILDYVGAPGVTGRRTDQLVAVATLPALIAVWGLHPVVSFRSLLGRRRQRIDASLLFWRAALLIAPLVGLAAVATYLLASPRFGLLFVWLALWGWAGMIVHGMLTRIVPFLVWFHRFAPLVGRVRVPSVRGLLPDAWTRHSFGLHVATLLVGIAAILSGSDTLARLLGVSLLLVAGSLLRSLVHVARQRPESE